MHPQPLFYIFEQPVYAYGLCMGLGIIFCFVFLMWVFWYRNFNDEASNKILLIGGGATLFGIFMAMVFQSLYNYIDDLTKYGSAKFTLDTSMTFYGGLIGGVSSFLIVWNLYVFVIAPRAKVKFLQNNMNATLSDALPIIPIGITIAHAFGRLGCFFGGCCYGAQTDAWYGIACQAVGGVNTGIKVIPTQLFECIFLVALTAIMIVLYFRFNFNCNFGLYAVVYGIWRFSIEFARDDYRGSFIPGLTPSQLWAIVMVVLGIAYFFAYKYIFKRLMKHPELQPRFDAPEEGEESAQS